MGKDSYGLDSFSVFNEDGSSIWAYSWSGPITETITDIILDSLNKFSLRLELTQVNMMTSKNVIYYV